MVSSTRMYTVCAAIVVSFGLLVYLSVAAPRLCELRNAWE
jgi:hypothetical protein